jgi:hypothetical protein
MTQTNIKILLCFVPKFPSSFSCIALPSNAPQPVITAKDSILYIRMVIKRTFQNHNGLILNDLRDFIGGGGVKRPKYYVVQTPYS